MDTFGRLLLERPGEPEQTFNLSKATVTVGRATVSDVTLPDAKVSRNHARFDLTAGTCTVVDLGSSNGTLVNGRRIDRPTLLSAGDVVQVGDSALRFEPSLAKPDPNRTVINTEADLRAALVDDPLSMNLVPTDLPRLAIYTPERTWELTLLDDTVTIGRDPAADVSLPFAQASRNHARIERRGGRFLLRDLESLNGTWLGSRRLDEYALQDGDTVRIGAALLTFKRGFVQDELTIVEPLGKPDTTERTPVVFVPGGAGSELWLGEERIWPNLRHLVSHPEMLRLNGGPALEARQITREIVLLPNVVKLDCYNRVGDYLEEALGYERDKDLLEFPYDWRQDNRLSAERLAAAIDAWGVKRPVTVIAHSMGCLVARWYVEKLGGKLKVGRLLLIGGPQLGSVRMVSTLAFGRKVLPFGVLGNRLAEVMSSFPSMYQIQPHGICGVDQYGNPIDLFADDRWLQESGRTLLKDAHAFQRDLGVESSVPTVFIFGYGQKTPISLRTRRDDNGRWQKLDFQMETTGDDTIPQTRAVLPGSEIHPVQQSHGSLYFDTDVKMRLKVELTRESGVR